MREGDMDKGNPSMHIDPSIEESYADIGRSVVAAAMNQSGDGGGLNEQGEIDINVTLRLKVEQSEAAGMMPRVCCVCTKENGVTVCRGMCCPGQPDW
jgi:hypothetical protein